MAESLDQLLDEKELLSAKIDELEIGEAKCFVFFCFLLFSSP